MSSLAVYRYAGAAVAAYVAYRVLSSVVNHVATLRRVRRISPSHKIAHQFINPLNRILSMIIPTDWMTWHENWEWKKGYKQYREYATDDLIFSVFGGKKYVFVANPDLAKIIFDRREDFPKPTEIYVLLDIFGPNVVTTGGEIWRRHRKISAPQFSEKNNMLVHNSTIDVTNEMFRAWDAAAQTTVDGKRETTIVASDDAMNLALSVFSAAAYGKPLQWSQDEATIPKGHKITLKASLEIMSHHLPVYLILPDWAYSLPFTGLASIKTGFSEFVVYMREFIADAKASGQTKTNLLENLVCAADEDIGKLTETELIGNAFIFMFAGHETTANALTFTLAIAAYHPEVQDKLFAEVSTVLQGRDPEYKDYSSLVYTQAVMNEILRLFPPVTLIPKCTRTTQQLGNYTIDSDTEVYIDAATLHRNPKYWGPDPDGFRPDRFLEPYNRNAFVPFSVGPRACLGQKFAQVEYVCALARIVQRYSWRPIPGVTEAECLEAKSLITLKTIRPPRVIMVKRE
ncbi:cytochrome P450 [Polychytrium aggregatum]|uniref:cytochrome P450 n=1 Tax=Polychytrium aggregatum TaxID=110093 RepID=UPI0022FDD2E6|nr:cytochrome P450 [Polychytrium aggregatum]KAI9193082.1 cytochrome P450 [Polychytrium aggregatum]